MTNLSNWKIRGKRGNNPSVFVSVFVTTVFVAATIGAMMSTCLMSVIMLKHHGQIKDFSETNVVSMQNFLIVLGCAVEGVVLVVFILLSRREGVSNSGLCGKSTVLLTYGAISCGFGISYIIMEHVPTLLSWNLKLAGIASEVGVMLVALLGVQIAACGCYKNTVFDLVTSSGILGCLVGSVRAYQVDTYFGTMLIDSSWGLVADVLIYAAFYSSALSLSASLIARAHMNRSFVYICCGVLLPIALAGGFGCFTQYPLYISSPLTNTIVRYSVGGVAAGFACILAVVAFRPFKVAKRSSPVPEDTESIRFAKSLMTVSGVAKSDSSETSV